MRVLYSFPHKLGADRICDTAWQQINGLVSAGVEVICCPGVLQRPLPRSVLIRPTLARGKFRIPYKVLGTMRSLALHDYIVSRRLRKLAGKIDLIHAWPAASLQTLKEAKRLGIPTVIERPNAHTRYALESVAREFEALGLELPHTDEYFPKPGLLDREEKEYQEAGHILCASDFTLRTFLDMGFPAERLIRHTYGFDPVRWYPAERRPSGQGLTMLFAGVCAVRKGVHFALEAWLNSPASKFGRFLIAGSWLESYREKLAPMLSHPSIQVLGQRSDLPELMRSADIVTLPSIEEGYGLVIAEGMGSGCVPLASEACTEICRDMETGLVHRIGEVQELSDQITMLHEDRCLLGRLRQNAIRERSNYTWKAAGIRLAAAYTQALFG